jgi:hypothetical protein
MRITITNHTSLGIEHLWCILDQLIPNLVDDGDDLPYGQGERILEVYYAPERAVPNPEAYSDNEELTGWWIKDNYSDSMSHPYDLPVYVSGGLYHIESE